MHSKFPFHPNRYSGVGAKRRSSFATTAGAAAALGALAGCGSDGGGAGTITNGAVTGTAGDNSIDEVSRGAALMTVDAGAGNDTVNTGVGAQTISGGVGDDAIDGGDGVDTAVFAGAVTGYRVTAALNGTDVSFTVDDTAAAAGGDDGTDTLSGIEILRFGADSFAVFEHDATGRIEADSEIIFGNSAPNGDGTMAVDGGAGDDLLFGFGGGDVLVGGAGHDRIFGGDDNDTLTGGEGEDTIDGGEGGEDVAVYSGERTDYQIWRVGGAGDDPERFFVLHRSDAAGNDGRDTLTNVEMIQFGDDAAVALNADLASDSAGIVVADNAPTGGAELRAGAAVTAIDVSAWFDAAGSTVTYSVMGDLPEGVTFEDNMLGGVAPTETATITIVASNVDDRTYDDVSHWYVINVSSAPVIELDDTDNTHVDTNMFGMENAFIEGLAGNDTITGGVGDDTLYGNSATALGVDGESDTAVYEGTLAGYAISVELHTFNMGGADATPEAPNTPRITVRDTATTGSGAVNEGTDRLVGFEVVRFGNATDDDDSDDVNLVVVRGNAGRTPMADVDEIVIGSAAADGTDAASALMGGGGDDFMFGLGGDDFLSGGGGSDTVSGGAGNDVLHGNTSAAVGSDADIDTAVYFGEVDDYAITVALDGNVGSDTAVPQITVMDDETADDGYVDTVDDEGTDTLTDFDALRFEGGTAPVTLMIVRAGMAASAGTSAAEILLGDDTANMMLTGLGGDDFIFGFGMDDVITGGFGDDMIDGGAGDDTAVFAGAVEGYRVSATLSGNDVTFTVADTDTTMPAAPMTPDEGTDTLTGIEMLRFGTVTMSMVADPGATGRMGDDAEIIVGDDMADGATDAGMAVDGEGGDDLIFGFDGDDFLSGGAGDDVIDGGAGDDTAVFAGAIEGYSVFAALSGDVLELTVEDDDASENCDDGTDTLIAVETVRFGTEDFAVVRHYTAGRTLTDDADEIIVGRALADGTNLLTALVGGSGDDLIFGLGGDDHLQGGLGDDLIDGGMGNDTAHFAGARTQYLIWQSRDTLTTFVRDRHVTADGGDEGVDTLVAVENLAFDGASVELSGITFDTAPPTPPTVVTTSVIPAPSAVDYSAGMTTNASAWFSSDVDCTTYSLSGSSDYTINAMSGVITHPTATPHPMVSVTVTASVVDNENFDDVTHTVTFSNLTAPGTARGETIEDVDARGSEASMIEGLAGDDMIRGGAGDDTLYGNSASVLEAVGEMDTAIYAGEVEHYAISAELFEFMSTPTVANTPRIIIEDEEVNAPAAPAVSNEGRDTLVGFEVIRFQHGTPDDPDDDDVLMVFGMDAPDTVRTETFKMGAEILLGTETGDGESGNEIDGGAGADHMFGFGGNDFLSGGEGDDVIDGGMGTDTAVYLEDRSNYLIWDNGMAGDDRKYFIRDKFINQNGNEGLDELSGVEMVKFGDADAVNLNEVATDSEPPALMVLLPVDPESMTTIIHDTDGAHNFSSWFSGGATRYWVDNASILRWYQVSFPSEPVLYRIGVDLAYTSHIPVTVYASIIDDGDFDDVSVSVFFHYPPSPPSPSLNFPVDDPDDDFPTGQVAQGNELIDPNMGGDNREGIEMIDPVTPIYGDGDYFGF